MPRLKGCKNKKTRRDSFTTALYKVLPTSTITIIQRLALRSNIAVARVLDDAVLEGAAELETEAYASLITFNARRGKVIHEREPERINEASETATQSTTEAGEVDSVQGLNPRGIEANHPGSRDDYERPGRGTEIQENLEPLEPREPREIPF